MKNAILITSLFLLALAGCSNATYDAERTGTPSAVDALPSRCLLGAEFSCEGYSIEKTAEGATIRIAMKNQMNEDVRFTNPVGTAKAATFTGTCTADNEVLSGAGTVGIECHLNGVDAVRGDNLRVTLDIEYTPTSAMFPRTISGEIRTQVE